MLFPMTTITGTEALRGPATTATTTTTATTRRTSRALAVRRGFLIASPVLAGLFAFVGAYADPAAGISGQRMFEIYIANPEPLQFKSLGYHWAYAFWIAPALLVAGYVKGKGAWLANVAAFVGFVGMTTLPGLLFVDWYDSAIGQMHGLDGLTAVHDHMNETMWGVMPFTMPGIVGLFLALPLATIALWRGGVVRWWAFVAVVAGTAAFMLSSAMWWGCVITTACFTVFAVALAKGTRPQA
jgi:hypothetical protein